MSKYILNKISISILLIGLILFISTASYLGYGIYSTIRLSDLNATQNTEIINGYSADIYIQELHPRDWAFPIWGEKDNLENINLIRNISNSANFLTSDLDGPAIQMLIPAINVNSKVEQLNIISENNAFTYETPKNMIGRIATNIERMNSVSGWYFGHLDSPIQREGNVFQNLPNVATHIKNGDPVLIYIQSLENEYIYKAISSEVIHEADLKLYDAEINHIILVTCSNKPLYNYRQLVTAELIAIN